MEEIGKYSTQRATQNIFRGAISLFLNEGTS